MQKALNNMPEEMEKMLQRLAQRYVKNARAIMRTPADIYEHPSHCSFILDMPGLQVSNIKVKVDNGILHISGKQKKKSQSTAVGNEARVKAIRI